MTSPTKGRHEPQLRALQLIQWIADLEMEAGGLGRSQAAKYLRNLTSQARRYLYHLDKGECRESKTSLPEGD
jgi:hypothetical protein